MSICSERRSCISAHTALVMGCFALLLGCTNELSGVFEAGPAPAARPLTSGDYHLEAGEVPRPGEPIRFALSPTAGSEAVRRQYTPVADFLTSVLGVPIELTVASTYDDLVGRVASNQVDLALLPPLSYVIAKERTPSLELLATAMNRVRTTYSAFILVRHNDRAQTLSDLGGRRIALVSPSSTSGYLLPMHAFSRYGLDPENFFSEIVMAGTHTAALEMLVRGQVDAAATATGMREIARLFSNAGEDFTDRTLRILVKTGEAPYDAFCAVGTVSAEFKRKVRGALALMNSRNEAARPALEATETLTGWLVSSDRAYDKIRAVRKSQLESAAAEGTP